MRIDRYQTALELIVREDINRTLIHAGRQPTPTDQLHTLTLSADWRMIAQYRKLGVMVG